MNGSTRGPSGFGPSNNFFNQPLLRTNSRYAWRSMGKREFDRLIEGALTYTEGPAKKTRYFAPTPDSAAQYAGKGRYLVEFEGVESKGEGLVGTASRDNITAVWEDNGGEWIRIDVPAFDRTVRPAQNSGGGVTS